MPTEGEKILLGQFKSLDELMMPKRPVITSIVLRDTTRTTKESSSSSKVYEHNDGTKVIVKNLKGTDIRGVKGGDSDGKLDKLSALEKAKRVLAMEAARAKAKETARVDRYARFKAKGAAGVQGGGVSTVAAANTLRPAPQQRRRSLAATAKGKASKSEGLDGNSPEEVLMSMMGSNAHAARKMHQGPRKVRKRSIDALVGTDASASPTLGRDAKKAASTPAPAPSLSNGPTAMEQVDTIYVGGLPEDCRDEAGRLELETFFGRYGNVTSVSKIVSKGGAHGTGSRFAFVRFVDPQVASRLVAMSVLGRSPPLFRNEQTLVINWSTENVKEVEGGKRGQPTQAKGGQGSKQEGKEAVEGGVGGGHAPAAEGEGGKPAMPDFNVGGERRIVSYDDDFL